MAGYLKQLLLDCAQNKLPIEIKVDLLTAIEDTYHSGVYSLEDIYILDLYLQGYTVYEICTRTQTSLQQTQNILERLFETIATLSGYTDDKLIHLAESNKRYRTSALPMFSRFLNEYGHMFETHDVQS